LTGSDSYRGAPGDGSAWASGCSGDGRGLRGGSWNYYAWDSRAANRINYTPDIRYNYIGFRLARTR